MTFYIPQGLKEYYGNVAIRRAVDALSASLDGTNMPEVQWEEARNYNQALLMAAQVRTDLVDLLFRVWDESFGKAEPYRLGEDYFEWCEGAYSLSDIWKGKELGRFYYRDQLPPGEDKRSDGLGVNVSENRDLRLFVVRYEQGDSVAEPGAIAGTAGWESTHDATGGYDHLVNQSVDVRHFSTIPALLSPGFAPTPMRWLVPCGRTERY